MLEIPVLLTNRYAKFTAEPDVQAQLKRFFRFKASQETLDRSARYASGDWNGYVELLSYSKVGTGLFLLQREKIEQRLNCKLAITDKRKAPQFREIDMGRAWAHQKRAVDGMVQHSDNGGLVISATGTGKTELAALYFKRLLGSGVFVVDEVFLAEQSQKAIARVLGEPVGFVGRGEFNPRRITVAIVQTLDRAIVKDIDRIRINPKFQPWFREVQVMMFDEFHTAINERTESVIKAVNPLAVFGLTATLQMQRLDIRLRAIDLTGPPIMFYSIVQGQRDEILQKGTVFQIPFENSLADCSYNHGICRNRERNNLVQQMAEWAIQQGRSVVIMAERRLHLRVLAHRFRNVKHAVISGAVSRRGARAAIIEKMRTAELPLVVASRVFFKGVDVPQLDTIIDATGLPGANSAIQRFGRGVRKAEGKRDLIYMDISDFTTPAPKPGFETNVELATQSRLEAYNQNRIPVVRLRPGQTPPCDAI